MTIEEMFRRIVRAHLGVILVCTLLPIAVAIGLHMDRPKLSMASVRVQVISGAPSTATEAEGISSRVLALATTPSLLGSAMKQAKVQRDLADFAATHVAAQRLGESSIVELSVTDHDPEAAGRIAVALSAQVATFMNTGDRAAVNAARSKLDKDVAAANRHLDQLTNRLRGTAATDLIARAGLQAQIQSADQLIGQLTNQRAMLQIADATRDVVVPIGTTPEISSIQSALLPQAALALLFGLVLGLTAATVLETFRPRVSSVRALARMLQAPVLGKSTEDIEALRNTMALAARRQGVDAVVLMGAEDRDAETVNQLLFALSGSAPVNRRQKSPSNSLHGIEHAGEDRVFELDDGMVAPFANVRFTGLSAVTPADEMTAGVVVVSAGTVLVRRLDDLDDVLKAVRWPVLGIVHGPSRRRFRGWR
jgi:capsular polysaccharide biosynthesis protein